jgi:choline dehydrogenase-like flavoprotein/heme-degrading monooxygenase HmoA
MNAELNETRRTILRSLCDTFVPSIKVQDDPTGFWVRTASDLGVDRALAGYLAQDAPEELRDGLLGLLDHLAGQGFVEASQDRRESILGQLSHASPQMMRGITFYEKQTLLLTYALPAEPVPDPNLVTYGSPRGQNPNWEALGYPGPVSMPPDRPKQIRTLTPEADSLVLEANVCVVGSGAGGAVIAARLAMQGRSVLVLESGGYYNSADFHQLELWGYKHLWYKGGVTTTADGNVNILAGGTLGGGTEINWMNCVRTPALIREEWAKQYGIEGVDTAEFDRYIGMVERRISASPQTSYFNSQNLRMREGCARLGYLSRQTHINWEPKLFQPLMAGYSSFGDQTGAKQTARRTYLLDAYQNGARIMVHCRADRILVNQGRAVGVEANYSDGQGRKAKVTVYATQVVVACGSLESPALLLRSGVGGPAVGRYFHVHPGGAVSGVYKEKQKGWWGSPQTTNCEQFVNTGDGFGFYLETPAFGPGFVASVIPWTSGRQHKEVITKIPYTSTFIWFLRDRGCGQVTIDKAGNSLPTYELADEMDQKNFRRATVEAIRIHEAAGAEEILFSLAHEQIVWTRGENLESYIQTIMGQPLLNGAQPIISAHQLGSCRMGRDPNTSVADTDGELHDVKGVWIGDGSAFPTALGANPMVTIMALAERTAGKMAASSRQNFDAMPRVAQREFSETAAFSSQDFDSMPRLVRDLARGMIGVMMIPFNIFAMGGQLLLGRLGNAAAGAGAATQYKQEKERQPMYCQVVELTAQPGRAKELINAFRDQVMPQIVRPSEGFVDEIVLLSDADPNQVAAISFWRSKTDLERFKTTGLARVSALLQPLLSARPERREFVVGASTNDHIVGW